MAHLHCDRLIRLLASVSVLFSVEHVVRQSLLVIEIGAVVLTVVRLLIIEDDAFVFETRILEQYRTALVRADVAVLLRKSDVVPDHVARCIQIVLLVVLFRAVNSFWQHIWGG